MVAVISGVMIGLCITGQKTEDPNLEVDQTNRWTQYFAFIALAMAGANIGTALIFAKIGLYHPIIPIIVGVLAGGGTAGLTKVFFTTVPGNKIALATPVLFGTIGEKGIILYKLFHAGFKAKSPWESIDNKHYVNLEKIGDILGGNPEIEFDSAVGKLKWSGTLQPDQNLIQKLVNISIEEGSRNAELKIIFNQFMEGLISNVCKGKKIEVVMADRAKITKKILDEKATNGLKEKEEMYGVTINSLLIGDIDYSPEVKKANENVAVIKRLFSAVEYLLKKQGYSAEQIALNKKPGGVPKDVMDEAWRIVRITSDEVEAYDVNISGLEGLSQEAKEDIVRVAADNLRKRARGGQGGAGQSVGRRQGGQRGGGHHGGQSTTKPSK